MGCGGYSRFALLGITARKGGQAADSLGIQAVTCQRSGMITRGYNLLRDTVAISRPPPPWLFLVGTWLFLDGTWLFLDGTRLF